MESRREAGRHLQEIKQVHEVEGREKFEAQHGQSQ